MGNAIEFILKLQDLLSPGMRAAANISNSASNTIQNQFTNIANKGNRMGASVNELRNRLEAVNLVRFSTTHAREFDIATKAAERLERQIGKLENKGSKPAAGNSMLSNIVGGNLISGGISKAAGVAKDFVVGSYDTAMKRDSLSTAINSTTGGQGAETIKQTRGIVDKYGIDYEASLEGTKILTGGLKSMNMPLAEQMKIFEGVSVGAAAMKISADDTKGAMLALGQMASKGTVSAEELRGQLAERIPGAFGIAAKAMNVTESELGKMMQRGEVAAKDFLPKFAAEMQKTFGADALEAAKGPAAIQAKFNNAVGDIKEAIGKGIMPLFIPILEKFAGLASDLLPYIKTGFDYIKNGVNYISDFITSITAGTSEWSGYFDIIKGIAVSIWETISSIASVAWSIVSSVAEWAKKSNLIKDIFWALGGVGKGIFSVVSGIASVLGWIWNTIIMPVLNAIEWVYTKVKDLLGLGGKTEIKGTAGLVVSMDNRKLVPPATGTIPPVAGAGDKTKDAGGNINAGSNKSEAINSGGQRSIVINIGKQVEKLEVHVMNAKEGATQIESMVSEALQRAIYNLNAKAS